MQYLRARTHAHISVEQLLSEKKASLILKHVISVVNSRRKIRIGFWTTKFVY